MIDQNKEILVEEEALEEGQVTPVLKSTSVDEELKCTETLSLESDALSDADYGIKLAREPTVSLDLIMGQVYASMRSERSEKNNFRSLLRLFILPVPCRADFISCEKLDERYQLTLCACYIFKMRNKHSDGYSHGIFVRVNGFANRRLFEKLVKNLVAIFIGNNSTPRLMAVTPKITAKVALFDYLQSIFVIPKNLLVKYGKQRDLLSFNSSIDCLVDHTEAHKLCDYMKKNTHQIMNNMVTIPSMYTNSQLYQLLQMDQGQHMQYMRKNTLSELAVKICQDAYSLALQDQSLKTQDIQQLMDPLTRRGIINCLTDDKFIKQMQLLVRQTFARCFVHPHPLVHISKGELQQVGIFEGMLFDAKFLLPLLLCARWFASMTMRKEENITNNRAHLMLYGQSGSGKSFLLSVLSSNVPTYKYLTTGRFQNPDALCSSFFYLDEFDTVELATNNYKALLDIKQSVKIDFKNLHPENATMDVPCLISSNDDVLTVLKNAPARKVSFVNPQISQYSVDAAIRRLYMIPLRQGRYDELHGKVNKNSKFFERLSQFNESFIEENNKLDRVFNLIFAFGLFQRDMKDLQMDSSLYPYMDNLVHAFPSTLFGSMYLCKQTEIDSIIQDVETKMILEDLSDQDLLRIMQSGSARLHAIMKGCVKRWTSSNVEDMWQMQTSKAVMKDEVMDVPWPIKIYYAVKVAGLRVPKPSALNEHLNVCVNAFLQDNRNHQFGIDEYSEIFNAKRPAPLTIDNLFLDSVLAKQVDGKSEADDMTRNVNGDPDDTMYTRILGRKRVKLTQ